MVSPASSSSHLLVVGGGIAGIVAALRARAGGARVTLVERAPVLGGLLASEQPWHDGLWFDHGTHIPAQTGEAALDEVLFGGLPESGWTALPVLKAATFWNGRLCGESACLDLRTLPAADYAAVLPGMLSARHPGPASYDTLTAQLTDIYGEAMLHTVFTPVLQKFYGTAPAELAPNAHLLCGLGRFVCHEADQMAELKKNPLLDRKLAYHRAGDTPATARAGCAWYPREGGAGRWIDALTQRLHESGVTVLTGTQLQTLDPLTGSATLAEGRTLAFDRLAWSLPAGMLLRLCGHAAASTLRPPRLSSISLHHFVADQAPLTDAYYVTCHDHALRSFRVTLYSNLQPAAPAATRVTVEVLGHQSGPAAPAPDEVFAELQRMGLFADTARCLRHQVREVPAGFPIQTGEQRRQGQEAAEIVARDYPGVRLLGRAAGQSFFMRDVLLDAWRIAP